MRSGPGSSPMGFGNVSIRGTTAVGESGKPRSALTGLAILSKRLFLVHLLEGYQPSKYFCPGGFPG